MLTNREESHGQNRGPSVFGMGTGAAVVDPGPVADWVADPRSPNRGRVSELQGWRSTLSTDVVSVKMSFNMSRILPRKSGMEGYGVPR